MGVRQRVGTKTEKTGMYGGKERDEKDYERGGEGVSGVG